jgi:hypothetical protein
MRRTLLVAAFLAACCCAGLWLKAAASSQGTTVQGPQAKGVRWGYAVYSQGDLMGLGEKTIHGNLNKLGEDGWELVAVAPGLTSAAPGATRETTYFFKRPK